MLKKLGSKQLVRLVVIRQFKRGPVVLSKRGTGTDDTPAFVVSDGNYVSARWPGDVHTFARTLAQLLDSGL